MPEAQQQMLMKPVTAAAPAPGSSLSVASLAPVLCVADGNSSGNLPTTSVTAASGAKYNSQRPYAIMNRRASNNASAIDGSKSTKKSRKFRFRIDCKQGEFSLDSRHARASQDSGRNY